MAPSCLFEDEKEKILVTNALEQRYKYYIRKSEGVSLATVNVWNKTDINAYFQIL